MREILLKLCLNRLDVMNDCIKNYDSHWDSAATQQFTEIPTSYAECEAIGKFLQEFGAELKDYELVGIGQTLIAGSEALLIEEYGNHEREEELRESLR